MNIENYYKYNINTETEKRREKKVHQIGVRKQ